MSNLACFWMVYGTDQRAPAVRHSSEAVAIAEAQRLARNNPGIEFFVLESVARAVKADVAFDRIKRPDQSPF